MREGQPSAIYLSDYQAPSHRVVSLDLSFELGEEATLVTHQARYQRMGKQVDLHLNGEQLTLVSLELDGKALNASDYRCTDTELVLFNLPEEALLKIVTRIEPQKNTSLEGLYQSSGNFCTQCEAQGFRKITYYLDRPDVMTVFTTEIIADKHKYPVLLSNGNLIAQGELADNRHWARWYDPYPKPAYLFALVAGNLLHVEDQFTTASGRDVTLRIYTEAHNIDKCDHAMASLKRAMQWDEQRFGLEYDLDIYMIVAVDDFNMGAMENKGLNVFNSQLVFASQETATDADYIRIESVIGHEYFHNWTGNRVTCRDWFQLSLKEGLTVFRDQEFTADLHSRPVERIESVRTLRTYQFAEDASPMAHPIRPSSYIEINNFYTMTVYEKGAEVVRLYQTLLGQTGFRKGMDLYFERHDGQAVTTEDFLAAMADANQVDLSQFQRWYDQEGTPEVNMTLDYDADAQRCTLHFKQQGVNPQQQPYLIPIEIGLLAQDGQEMPLQLAEANDSEQQPVKSLVLRLEQAVQSFSFANITECPVPSVLRNFSAPVRLHYDYSEADLIFLMCHDQDAFNRWDAGQRLAQQNFKRLLTDLAAGDPLGLAHEFISAWQSVLTDERLDAALRAEALSLPSEADIAEVNRPADPSAIHTVREFVLATLAKTLRLDFEACYHAFNEPEAYHIDAVSIGQRRLKNVCLQYLSYLDDSSMIALCVKQYADANNMTDSIAALSVLINLQTPEREKALQHFHDRWQHDTLVMDKWFSLQAAASLPDALDRIQVLMQHRLFDMRNPNKVRALIGSFTLRNPLHFHAPNGSGYAFLAERVLELNTLNPQIAARMVRPLMNWRHYESSRAALMRTQLERIQAHEDLSPDVFEIVSKSL